MTVDDLLAIVCRCLDDVGITPDDEDVACADWDPRQLDLDQPTLVKLIACITKKVKRRGQTVVIGKTMWRKSKTVRDFCEALVENLE